MADEKNEQAEEMTDPEIEAEVEQPAAEADTAESEAETEAEEPAVEAEAEQPVAEARTEELAAEAEAEADEPTADAEEPAVTAEEPSTAEAEPAAPVRKKKKRLPRSLRPARTKPKREKPKERRPIVRLPKPEHSRGRRQERQGKVVSSSTDKTIVVRVDTVKVHPRYKKVIRHSTKLHAHDETNEAKVGDVVLIVETRPLSKLKRWRLQKVVEAAK
jgi:small subunit ribosomal protein S17